MCFLDKESALKPSPMNDLISGGDISGESSAHGEGCFLSDRVQNNSESLLLSRFGRHKASECP
jgi:hypothetical protein